MTNPSWGALCGLAGWSLAYSLFGIRQPMEKNRFYLSHHITTCLLQTWLSAFFLMAFMLICANCASDTQPDILSKIQVPTSSELNKEAVFWYRLPLNGSVPTAVLLLIPGYNGEGRGMLESGPWARFADEQHMVLVGPTFKTTPEEMHSGRGYYYPELWSGEATLKALEQIRAKTGVRNDKVFLFGFSAGAHFVHRFALWRPEKVAAFVAYSAGWWNAPKSTLRNTPGLIMCGEADERFEPTYAFFAQGRRLGLPLIWRSYSGIDHEVNPKAVKMAQAFLDFYARDGKPQNFIGDIQAYRYYFPSSADAQHVPPESRVILPSRKIAEVWQEEQ